MSASARRTHLEVDLEELVAEEHHPPLLGVVDAGPAVTGQNRTGEHVVAEPEHGIGSERTGTDLSLAQTLKQLISCSAAFSSISPG